MHSYRFHSRLFSAAAACLCLITAGMSLRAENVLLEDKFESLDTSNTWALAKTPEASEPAVEGGLLVAKVTGTSSSQRSVLISKSADFSPFGQKTSIEMVGLLVSGSTVANGYSGNMYYVMVGNINDGRGFGSGYCPWQPADKAGFLALTYQKCATVHGIPFTRIEIYDVGAQKVVQTMGLYGEAVPSSMVWTIDGNKGSWSIKLEGDAAFYPGEKKDITYSESNTLAVGKFSQLTAKGVASGSYIALGAANNFVVTAPTQITLKSIKVTTP